MDKNNKSTTNNNNNNNNNNNTNNNNNNSSSHTSSNSNSDGTEFRDLLRGRIDIIQYLTAAGSSSGTGDRSGAASVENGLSGLPDLDDKLNLHAALMLPSGVNFGNGNSSANNTSGTNNNNSNNNNNNNNNNNSSSSVHQQESVPPNQSLTVQAGPSSCSATAGHRTPMFRMDGGHPVRLPDSPPETDSGAGSAGSPSSGSENSPYSPFQNYNVGHGLQGTVIHPPVGHHPAGHGHPHHQTTGAGGVILGVHNMDLTQLVHQEIVPGTHGHSPTSRVTTMSMTHHHHPHHTHAQHNGPSTGGEFAYPPPQPTPGALAPPQVSPPSIGGSTCPPSPFVLPNASGQVGALDSRFEYTGEAPGSLNRKRMRGDNGQYVKKTEPASPRTSVEESVYDLDGYHQQCIRFSEFQKESFHQLCDPNGRELQRLGFHVVADKGFNFSAFDTTFVNQKKNHFQISVHIEVPDPMPPKYIRVDGGLKPVSEFRLDFFGVKAEMPSSVVHIKQSQTDRKPVPYEPVKLDLPAQRVTKVTVARLHFSETTMNNQRKNGRPNPDQKYFLLIVSLNAVVQGEEDYRIIAYASEKVIVRASNPGQFDSGESEVHWQKGPGGNSIFHPGVVCIGTDQPLGPSTSLNVRGDIACTGQLFHPSDQRLKENVEEVNTADALSRLSQIRIVHYEIRPDVAEEWGLKEEQRRKMGVIAQELEEVIPDAVREDGEFLQVDDTRIFYESAAAVKELCRLTGNLEYKIDEVEKISKKMAKLSKLKRLDSLRSTSSNASSRASSGISSHCPGSYLSISRSSVGSNSPAPHRSKKEGVDNAVGPHVKYTPGRSRSGHRHGHCHYHCRGPDRGLCSNKVMQITIIMLVIVMAFWRNYPPSGEKIAVDKLSTTPSKPKKPGEIQIINGQLGTSSMPPFDGVIIWPEGRVPPLIHASCMGHDCKQYCCPNKNFYSVHGHEETAEGAPNFVMPETPLPVRTRNFDNERKPVGIALDTDTKDMTRKKRELKNAALKKESESQRTSTSQFEAKIEIIGFNVSIDERYCYSKQLCDDKKGNFTFYIPVSRHMPHIPLDIQFELENKRMFVEFCMTQAGEHCDGVKNKFAYPRKTEPEGDRVEEKNSNLFKLPVGSFQKSAYKFRVGFSRTSCNDPDDLSGQNYKEYNLMFYRVCSG